MLARRSSRFRVKCVELDAVSPSVTVVRIRCTQVAFRRICVGRRVASLRWDRKGLDLIEIRARFAGPHANGEFLRVGLAEIGYAPRAKPVDERQTFRH